VTSGKSFKGDYLYVADLGVAAHVLAQLGETEATDVSRARGLSPLASEFANRSYGLGGRAESQLSQLLDRRLNGGHMPVRFGSQKHDERTGDLDTEQRGVPPCKPIVDEEEIASALARQGNGCALALPESRRQWTGGRAVANS
jgi:hypothetical protein